MLNDNIFICRESGERVGPITASIQFPNIFVAQTVEDIQEGEVVERDLPTGRTERMRVVNATYLQRGGCSWQLEVVKLTADGSTPNSNEKHSSYTVMNSNNVQIGNGNSISITQLLSDLIETSENVEATPEERAGFKRCVSDLLGHPLFTAIAGGIAGSVVDTTSVTQG